MSTEIGDTLVVDLDQEGDLTLIAYDSETETLYSYSLTFEEAVFFSERLQQVVQSARELREENTVR